MVMEYASGETLKTIIDREGPIPEERAIRIVRKILEAVGYAHDQGIIHRDIKPSNIMIGLTIRSRSWTSALPRFWAKKDARGPRESGDTLLHEP